MDSIPTKRCSKCKLDLPATRDYFHNNTHSKDGLCSTCKECAKERARQWYEGNQQRGIDNAAKWKQGHRERVRELSRESYAKDPERIRELHRVGYWRNHEHRLKYHRELYHRDLDHNRERGRVNAAASRNRNPERVRANRYRHYHANLEESRLKAREHVARRRAWKLGSIGSHTKDDIIKQYQAQDGVCWWCGAELNGKYHVDHRIPLSKGGSDAPENICLTCPDCNLRKGSKMPYEFNGRLL